MSTQRPKTYVVSTYDSGGSAWWVTLPGVCSYLAQIKYSTGDTVFFSIDGTVDTIFTHDNFIIEVSTKEDNE